MTHTQGTWIATKESLDGKGGGIHYKIHHDTTDLRSEICVMWLGKLCEEHGSLDANARLIAAAPLLLEALIEMHQAIYANGWAGEILGTVDVIENAINAATGKE